MSFVRVLKVEPGKKPVSTVLGTELEELQKAVGGMIEFAAISEDCSILCNEEGKLKGFEPNRICGSDVLVGTFFVVKIDDEGELTDMSDSEIDYYASVFNTPLTQAERDMYVEILSVFRW